MTHEEICTYELCKLAKENGFNCKVYNYYQATKHYYETLRGIELHSVCWKLETDDCYSRYNKGSEDIVSAPTQSLLQRWLREEKGYAISVTAYPTLASLNKVCYAWEIKSSSDGAFMKSEDTEYTFSTYELALEDALKYALENLV